MPSLTVLIAIAVIVTACSANRGPTRSASASSVGPTKASEAATSPAALQSAPRASAITPSHVDDTAIRIRVGQRTITARLHSNPTARDLVDQLPLTLTFRDFNRLEKIAALPRVLSTKDAPAGADPDIGDIGYYAPSGDLVFYYGDVGYFSGIVRIGHIDSDVESIGKQPDGFTVSIDRADTSA